MRTCLALTCFFSALVFSLSISGIEALCRNVGPPCICSPSVAEPVSIVCNSPENLDMVSSALEKLGDITIDRLAVTDTPIEELQADNPLKSLRIRRLSLHGNAMWKIHPDAFDGYLTDNLEELDLKNNHFGEIPMSGVRNLKNLKRLNLSRNRINSLPPRAFFKYSSLMKITKLDLSRNYIGDLGNTSPFMGMGSLRDLNLENNYLKKIPTKALEAVRNSLQDLNLGSNGISSLPPNALNFPLLNSLSLEFNEFSRIEPTVFRRCPNLQYLYLTGGYKSNVLNPALFRYIPKLRGLGLGETPITNISIDAFKYIPDLVRLNLAESQIKSIAPGALQKCPKLEAVILHKCRLERIPREMFEGLKELYSIDLSGNRIVEVEEEAFGSSPRLQHLDLSSNLLSFLSPAIFSDSTIISTPKSVYLCYNPWDCSEQLVPLRSWLQENSGMMIDKDLDCVSQCTEPTEKAGVDLRIPPTPRTPPPTQPPTTTPPPQTPPPTPRTSPPTTTSTTTTTTTTTSKPVTVYVTPVTGAPTRRTTSVTRRPNGGNQRPSGLTIFQKMIQSLEDLVVNLAERSGMSQN